MKMIFLIFFTFTTLSGGYFKENVPKWYRIPTINGTWKWMHINEIEVIQKNEPELYYDPYKDVKFYLYTKKNQNALQEILINNLESLRRSNFNISHPIRVLTHGWTSGYKDPSIQRPKQAYFMQGEFNIIAVDWSRGASSIEYVTSANRVKKTGELIAMFIDFLVWEANVSLSSIYVIGHSLGAHVAGNVGKSIQSGRLPVIYGLDPAGPLFSEGNSGKRIDKSDADYVEIIHTNAGTLGYSKPLGHADFFPAGGSSQPGCGIDFLGSCAHARVGDYFAESIRISEDEGFRAIRCETFKSITSEGCTQIPGPLETMGGEPIKARDGLFWLPVNKKSPFAIGNCVKF